MPKFDPSQYTQAYETIAQMIDEFREPPTVNWVFWNDLNPKSILLPNDGRWKDVAIPAPYKNSSSLRCWKEGYTYFMSGGWSHLANPYEPYPSPSRGLHYAWLHGFVTAIWTWDPPDPDQVMPSVDELVRVHLRPACWEGRYCREYDRATGEWFYFLPKFKGRLLYPPVLVGGAT